MSGERIIPRWDEDHERRLRGLPSRQGQAMHGMPLDLQDTYEQFVKDRREVREEAAKIRAAHAAHGQQLVEWLAVNGISSSYEWTVTGGVVELDLDEMDTLIEKITRLQAQARQYYEAGNALAYAIAQPGEAAASNNTQGSE